MSDTSRVYHDQAGNKRTISQMVKCEQAWAANRIQAGEDAIAELAEAKAEIARMRSAIAKERGEG